MKSVIYARVSSKEQEVTGYSLPAQRKFLKEYAEKSGIRVAKVFSVAESASSKKERQVFSDMLDYCSKNNVSTIICEKIDRLTRKPKDAGIVDEWVHTSDKNEVHFVKEHFILSKNTKAHENFVWNMKVAVAKFYTDNLSEEVKKGQRAKIEAGWLPTKPPIGYKTIGEKGHKLHVVDEEIAPLIRKMFSLYDTGNYSTRGLGKKMYELGLRNRKGNEIGKTRMYDLLSDPFYYGDMKWNGEIYSGKQEPLISKELFQSVQKKLNRNIASPYFSKHTPTYKGKISCGECGRTVSWEKQKGHWYGGCKNCKAKLGTKKYIRQEDVDKEVLSKITAVAPKNEKILKILERAMKEDHKKEIDLHVSQKKKLEQVIERMDRRIDAMYIDKLDGNIEEQTYQVNYKLFKEEKESTQSQLKRLENDKSAYYEAGYSIHVLASRAKGIYQSKKTTTEERRLLLSYMFSNLSIKQGEITPNYTDAFKFLQEWMPALNKGFEPSKNVVNKGLKVTFSIPRPVLLRGQDSNL